MGHAEDGWQTWEVLNTLSLLNRGGLCTDHRPTLLEPRSDRDFMPSDGPFPSHLAYDKCVSVPRC